MLAGDTAGFPNGRRLADDVVDIELRVVGGFLEGRRSCRSATASTSNDKPFRATFPYVASPTTGFDSELEARPSRRTPPTPGQP